MRKTILAAVLALTGLTSVGAQEQTNDAERAKGIAARIEKSAERLAAEFGLKDEAKSGFVSLYTAYQQEMFATNQVRGRSAGSDEADGSAQKNLTDEEAAAKLQEHLARQEQQAATLQKRTEVQKRYSEEFSKMLTPAQVYRVIMPQRGRGRGQRDGQQGSGQRGRFEGDGPRGGFGGGFGGGPRGGF